MRRGICRYARIGLLCAGLLAAERAAAEEMTVMDLQGRSLEIVLLSADADTVTFRRKGGDQRFTLPLAQMDAASRDKIAETAKSLPAALPRIVPEVVIGKRRSKGDSYYMVNQTITCTVKLRNADNLVPLPKLTGRVLFFGQNQKTPGAYIVLSVQDFPVELRPGESSATELKSFTTAYDGDNKGRGNIGGYQYSGYLLVFLADDGEVLFNQTTDARIRQALADHPTLLKSVSGYAAGSGTDAKMAPIERSVLPAPIRLTPDR